MDRATDSERSMESTSYALVEIKKEIDSEPDYSDNNSASYPGVDDGMQRPSCSNYSMTSNSFVNVEIKQEIDVSFECPDPSSSQNSYSIQDMYSNTEVQSAVDSILTKEGDHSHFLDSDTKKPLKMSLRSRRSCDKVPEKVSKGDGNVNSIPTKEDGKNKIVSPLKKKIKLEPDSDNESDYNIASSDMGDSSSENESDDDDDFQTTGKSLSHVNLWENTHRSMKAYEFCETNNLLIPPPDDPFEYFRLFIDDELIDLIVEETNNKADLIIPQYEKPEDAKYLYANAKKFTREEVFIFIGLLMHTGTVRLTRMVDYWRKHWLFNLTGFTNFMTRIRFSLLFKCLDFAATVDENCLSKVSPVVNHFNKKISSVYYPGKDLIINENMVLADGKLFNRDMLSITRVRRGIKLCVLAEPDGTVVKCLVAPASSKRKAADYMSPKDIVFELLKEKLNTGHSVHLEEDYNSCITAQMLLKNRIFSTGRLIRIKNAVTGLDKVTLEEYENKSVYRNGLHLGKWKDKERLVYYLSTIYGPGMMQVPSRKGNKKNKPTALVQADTMLSSVSEQEKYFRFYPFKKAYTIWYQQVFIHILQMSLTNAFNLYQKYHQGENKANLTEFRLYILEKLLPNPFANKDGTGGKMFNEHKLVKIEKYYNRVRKNGNNTRVVMEVRRKTCKECSKANNRRTYTIYECRGCDRSPGYCVGCYWRAHT